MFVRSVLFLLSLQLTASEGQFFSSIFNKFSNGFQAKSSAAVICPEVQVVSRDQWGARRTRTDSARSGRLVTYPTTVGLVIAHDESADPTRGESVGCEGSEEVAANVYNQCLWKMTQIQDADQLARNLPDLRYHFYIGGNGKIYEGLGFRASHSYRPPEEGGHNYDQNALMIQFLGNYTRGRPPASLGMLVAMKQLLKCAVNRGSLSPNYRLVGRRQATCVEPSPGEALMEQLRKFRPQFREGDLSAWVCPASYMTPPPTQRPIMSTRPPLVSTTSKATTTTTSTPRPVDVGRGGPGQSVGSCGLRGIPELRIVNGVIALPGAWPWIALLTYKDNEKQLCGGALIHPEWVVTAAHCVARGGSKAIDPKILEVRLGEHDILEAMADTDEEQRLKVAEVIVHEQYRAFDVFNDIALIRLAKRAKLTRRVNTICLPRPGSDSEIKRNYEGNRAVGKRVWIAGWGLTASSGENARYLQEAQVKVTNETYCAQKFAGMWGNHGGRERTSKICAASDDFSIDACQNDSGGPMTTFLRRGADQIWYLLGVISAGKGCASGGYPGVYTRTMYYLDWIDGKMNSL